MFEFLKNISLNLKATGPAAVIVSWILAVAALGLFGEGPLAQSALNFLGLAGGMILFALAMKT